MNTLKIIGLKVDGYEKLSAVEMSFPPEGGCIFIRGENEQGKTSIIESLWWLFSGKTVINQEKIQHGKEKITGSVDLGDFTIERVQTEKSDRLEIKKKDGFGIIEKKQAFLDGLTNQLTFNPFPFLNLPAEKKLKFMMDFLKINFSELDTMIAKHEQERLFVGRDIKAIGEIQEIHKVNPVDVAKLLEEKNRIQMWIEAELEGIREENERQRVISISLQNEKDLHLHWESEVERLKDELEFAMEKLNEAKSRLDTHDQPVPINPEIASLNTTEIDLDILRAQDLNKDHENWKRNEEKRIQREKKEAEREKLTLEIEKLREAKKTSLSKAKTGVDGLEIRENGLYYNDIFLENCSDSEKLKISMKLCRTMNPPLRAVFLDRGASFDAARITEIEHFAAENDIQVFITQVADDIPEEIPSNVFYIVEGEVKK